MRHHEFGKCARVFCNGQPVLPVGESDMPRTNTVKVYCPKCEDLYIPRSARQASTFSAFAVLTLITVRLTLTSPVDIDGAYFGTTFAHLVFQVRASCVLRVFSAKMYARRFTPNFFHPHPRPSMFHASTASKSTLAPRSALLARRNVLQSVQLKSVAIESRSVRYYNTDIDTSLGVVFLCVLLKL